MKKILSLVLALMMVLSMASTAFATTFEDVSADEKALTNAAELLNGLKIITGYEDGTFKPGKLVTRAEMAAMLIRAKGYASIANDTPSFTDSQTHWAKGYIALASDLGIINGRGNGIFDPDATVTYEEAAIMMLRSLNYTDEAINNGKSTAFNAANYRAKALTLNLFKDFTLTAMKDGASRGNIALMLNRNLSNPTVSIENGKAIIDKDEDKNPILLLSTIAAKNKALVVDSKIVADKNNLVDMSQYLYQQVVAYISKDNGGIVFVEKVNSALANGTGLAPTANDITIKATGVKYTLKTTDANVFYNGAATTYDKVFGQLASAKVTLVLEAADSKVVTAIIAEKQTQREFMTSSYRTNSTLLGASINLPKKDGKVNLANVKVTGDVTSIEDIQANDVVKAYTSLDGNMVKLLVVRDSIEGKVTKASNDGSYVYVDSIGDYVYAVGITQAFTVSNGNINVEGTFYLDENGNIFNFVAKTTSTSTVYAMVTSSTNATLYSGVTLEKATLKIMNADGTSKTYKVNKDATIGDPKDKNLIVNAASGVNAVSEKAIISGFSLNDDGEISNVKLATPILASNPLNAKSKTFVATDNVAIFNTYGTGEDKVFATITLDQLKNKGEIAAANVKTISNKSGAYTVIVVDGVTIATSTPTFALITEQEKVVNADGKIVQQLVVYVNGEKITYLTNTTLAEQELTGELVELSVSNGLVVGVAGSGLTVDLLENTTTGSAITTVVGTRYKLAAEWYFMDEDAPVYLINEDFELIRVGVLEDVKMLGDVDVTVYRDGNIVSAIIITVK